MRDVENTRCDWPALVIGLLLALASWGRPVFANAEEPALANAEEIVRPGETYAGELRRGGAGRRKAFVLDLGRPGDYTLHVDSAQFDAAVWIEDRVVNLDRSQGLGELVDLSVDVDTRMRVVVGTPEGGTGKFQLVVHDEACEEPTPAEELDALSTFLAGYRARPDRERAWQRLAELMEPAFGHTGIAAGERLLEERRDGLPASMAQRAELYLGRAYASTGERARAIELLQRLTRSLPELEPELAVQATKAAHAFDGQLFSGRDMASLLFVAGQAVSRSDVERARILYEGATSFPDLPLSHRIQGITLLCELDSIAGDYTRTRARVEELESLGAELADATYRTRLAMNVAGHRLDLGEVTKALASLDQARAWADPGDVPTCASIELLYSWAYHQMGEWKRGLEHATLGIELLASRDLIVPERHVMGLFIARADCHLESARTLAPEDRADALDSARADVEYAMQLWVEQSGNPDVEGAYWLIAGELHRMQGELTEARMLFRRAAELFKGLRSGSNATHVRLLEAMVSLEMGDLAEAEFVMEDVLRVFESPAVSGLGPWGAADLRSRYSEYAAVAQDLSASRMERARSAQGYREHVARGFEDNMHTKYRALVESVALRREVDVASEASLERISEALGDRVLIDYACGSDSLYAYVLYRGELTHHVVSGDRRSTEARVEAHCELVFDARRSSSPARIERSGWELYDQLLEPLLRERELDPGADLVIVPTLALSNLPFSTLVTSAPAGEPPTAFSALPFVIQSRMVTYAPSARLLPALYSRGPEGLGDEAGGGLFVAGDPLTLAELGVSSADAAPRLASARSESLQVAELFSFHRLPDAVSIQRELFGLRASPRERSARLLADGLMLCIGQSLNAALFEQDLAGYAYLHFATHGDVHPLQEGGTGLVLSPTDGERTLLTAERVRALTLEAELVTLSSCGSALGAEVAAEGVRSMAAAFLEAGARSVVGSLYRVGDAQAASLMGDFYAAVFGSGTRPDVALREAQLKALASTGTRGVAAGASETEASRDGHPFDWAPFVLFGGF